MIYFYKNKVTGEIFPVQEKQANQYHGKLEQIGVSDGKIYEKSIQENRGMADIRLNEKLALEAKLDKLETAKDNLETVEFLASTDEKVKRAELRIKETQEELTKKIREHSEVAMDFVKNALDAELKVARGNFKTPPNNDYVLYDKNGGVASESRKKEIL